MEAVARRSGATTHAAPSAVLATSPTTTTDDDVVKQPTFRVALASRPLLVKAEYACYACYVAFLLFNIIASVHTLSTQRARVCRRKLLPPWPLLAPWSDGMDAFDGQWRQFSRDVGTLAAGLGVYVMISRGARGHLRNAAHYALVQCVLNVAVLLYLHRAGAIFVACQLAANFAMVQLQGTLPGRVWFPLVWAMHISFFAAANLSHGFGFTGWTPGDALAWLDTAPGLHYNTAPLRWYVVCNMMTLRLLAYNYDRWEATQPGAEAARDAVFAKHSRTCVECADQRGSPCYKLRTSAPLPVERYSARYYVAYATYIPLYFAGPVSSFNAYATHLAEPQTALGLEQIGVYGVRTWFIYLTLQVLLHLTHVNCLRVPAVFTRLQPLQMASVMYLTLAFLWLKFNVIWKFCRIVALLDGFEAPENMNRCFTNTTTVGNFWRDWHSSFNLWIVRYMYVPMGGNRAKAWTVVPIFAFIALWHDVELQLAWWAALISVVFVAELVVSAVAHRALPQLPAQPWYRHARAAGGTAATLGLIVANLFGYGTGMASAAGVSSVFTPENIQSAVIVVTALYAGNQLAVQHRDAEAENRLERAAAHGLHKA